MKLYGSQIPKDLIITKSDEQAVALGYYFDTFWADKAVNIVHKFLKLNNIKIILWEWQERIVRQIYGWRRPDGRKRFNRMFLFIPRKNGKSFFTALLCFIELMLSPRGSTIIAYATTSKKLKENIYNPIQDIILSSKLDTLISPFRDEIRYTKHRKKILPLSGDKRGGHGYNGSCVVLDELHEWTTPSLMSLRRGIESGFAAQKDYLLVEITTAGESREGNPAYAQYVYSKDIINGTTTDINFLPVIFEAGENDRWDDIETWKKANPSWNKTVNEEFAKAEINRAKADKTYQAVCEIFYLNKWVSSSCHFIDMEKYIKCEKDIDLNSFSGKYCYLGLDISEVEDLTSTVLFFPKQDGLEKDTAYGFLYAPNDTLKQKEIDSGYPYWSWFEAGFIKALSGDRIDQQELLDHIISLREVSMFDIKGIGIDRHLCQWLEPKLVEKAFNVIKIPQNYTTWTPALRTLDDMIHRQNININRNPVMKWCCANLQVSNRNDSLHVLKERDRKQKIDGATALATAIHTYQLLNLEEIKKQTANDNYNREISARGGFLLV